MKRRNFIKNSAGGTVLFYGHILKGCTAKKMYDLVITGGIVYDGTGGPGRETDIAVKNDRIVEIAGKINENKAQAVIKAGGMAVAPGFIDAHTHTDVELLVNPRAESKIRQGVTAEISGNCGSSLFPLSDQSFEENRKKLDREFGIELTWRDVKGFFSRLEESGMALNYATLLGHGDLRYGVMGPYDRPPTSDELNRMKQTIKEYMQDGVLGLSTGLEYTPGGFADTDELIELCREVKKQNGVYATHMRSEQNLVLEAIDEAVTISRQSGASLQISHLKTQYKENWYRLDEVLSAIQQAKNEGIPLLADRYPYIASSFGMSDLFPLWAREGTTADFIARLHDKTLESKIREHMKVMENKLVSWENVLICSVLSEKNGHLEGKTVLAAATEANNTPYKFMYDLLIEEDSQVDVVKFGMSEDNLRKVLAHPLVVIGSDGRAVAPYGKLGRDKPHPRFYGTFPRVLGKYAREEKIFDLSVAVKKMTSLTADKFGLTGRGRIAEGYFADMVVFNPDTVIDKATFTDPHQYPEGIVHVIVNGRIAIKDGEHTGELPGKILRKKPV